MQQRLSRIVAFTRSHAERGATMFLAAIMIIIVLLGGAIAVDLSITANRGQSLQNAADSAALAGVQALRQSMGENTEAGPADEQAARLAVESLLRQNGITDITPIIEFPDENDTEVRVTLLDSDPGLLLSGITGVEGSVEREATARFEACEEGCVQDIEIPPPFRAVNAVGEGDGYKPIPVGNRLYALNHNSPALQIVCVDRSEDSTDPTNFETDGLCWDTPSRNAYPPNFQPPRNPEMPNTAVVGSRIFWSVSVTSGHYLFCFETLTSTPCSTPYQINNSARNTPNPTRTENRGGGTFTPDQERVFVFTDDNRIHCILPQDIVNPNGQQVFVMEPCSGYGFEGQLTGLGRLASDTVPGETWPAGDPALGNHGSSIDRIYDPVTDRVYHTLHLDATPPTGPPEYCSAVVNVQQPGSGDVIVFKNVQSQLFLGVDAAGEVADATDPTIEDTHWEVLTGVWQRGRVYAFRSVSTGEFLIMNQDNGLWGQPLQISPSLDLDDSVFQIDAEQSSSQIHSYHFIDDGTTNSLAFIREEVEPNPVDPANPEFEFIVGEYDPLGNGTDLAAEWIIRPAECEIPDTGPATYQGVLYEQGTFIDCFDLSLAFPCPGFSPSKIHNDWDSFSGRLFFHMTGGTNPFPTGICSTGFTEHWEWKDMSAYTELACVDIQDGSERADLEISMNQFVSALTATNTGASGWGTWGDPHYSAHTNRLFYPTNREDSRVLCWDFDTGFCGARQAFSSLGEIQDYGFFSEGNCVFGLGHRSIFWAFKADNIFEECSGSSTTAPIQPCDCGGELFWGTLIFNVDLPSFESFEIQLHDAPDQRGNRIYPPEGWVVDPTATAHSLHDHGDVIDLNFLDATDRDQKLWVTVTVEADGDPWAFGDQTFTVQFERSPRLVG